MTTRYLACDLGAESGRLMLGRLDDNRLALEQLHRFSNEPIRQAGSLLWDIPRLFGELETGLQRAADSLPIASISTDSWGVDYLLYDEDDKLIEPTFHYRDARCDAGVEKAYAKISWPEIFAETGLQFMPFNTLFQLAAETPQRLRRARRILGVGDGFNHWLCGEARFEESLASTTQLYDPRSKAWSHRLLDALELPEAIFPQVVKSGTRLAPLKPELAKRSRLGGVEVVASCSHDTGAAVAAVPAAGDNWAYLSSGTWSLMGVERREPIITDECRELNFTNEIGYGGSIRLLKNIVGLWIVQECRREWAGAGHDFDYPALTRLAGESPAFVSLINPADPRFVPPGGMVEKVRAYCRETGQPAPETPGAVIRCVLESLALLYRRTLGLIEQLTGNRIERLHIVGGGSQNGLLNQFTANAIEAPVLTGPVEATAIGNILVQAIALDHLPTLPEARAVVRQSFPIQTVEPTDADRWRAAFARFERLP